MAKFLACSKCGTLIQVLANEQDDVFTCCGDTMEVLDPNTVDAAHEKHVPLVTVEGNKVLVDVGSVSHPMTEPHSINWIYLETKRGGQLANLDVTGAPKAEFLLAEGDAPVAAYSYCNLHGLWKTEL